MFKRSLLSLVLITGFVCPSVVRADNEDILDAAADAVSIVAEVAAEASTEVAAEAASTAAKAFQLIKDNKVALGAALVATAGAAAALAWYYGYFQTAENNQAENNQVA